MSANIAPAPPRAHADRAQQGTVYLVGAGPGDPGLLTARARAVLANAALVFTDPDVPEAVLALVGCELPPPSGPLPPVAAGAAPKPAAEAAAKPDDQADKPAEGDDASIMD